MFYIKKKYLNKINNTYWVRFDGIDLSVNYIHKFIKILTIIFINESIPKKLKT